LTLLLLEPLFLSFPFFLLILVLFPFFPALFPLFLLFLSELFPFDTDFFEFDGLLLLDPDNLFLFLDAEFYCFLSLELTEEFLFLTFFPLFPLPFPFFF
jgi:hypothetical protein